MDPEVQLHRHALYIAEKGDIVVVDARGDLKKRGLWRNDAYLFSRKRW